MDTPQTIDLGVRLETFFPDNFPASLRRQVTHHWQGYLESSREMGLKPLLNDDFLKVLCEVWAYSEFVASSCVRHPELFDELVHGGDLLIDYRADAYSRKLAISLAKIKTDEELGRLLRRFRRYEMIRIAWRDLAGWASLDETLRDLSALADSCLDGALTILHRWQSKEYGVPMGELSQQPQSLVVLGMGKLGAGELNFSSDVDLIFVFPEAGEACRPGCKRSLISNEEYFTRLGRRLIAVIDETTEEGFVFRVDMRLRPYGDSGPLVMSFGAFEEYYQSQGREWERYAMIKVRPVAGDLEQGQQVLTMLRPFVYRRYLDFGAFSELREMKRMIRRQLARKGSNDNVKLGTGGIREVEFIGQAFQLIRGGREPELQRRPILTILRQLAVSHYLPDYVVDGLVDAYCFLRDVENRLQAFEDKQTHLLPSDDEACLRLALSMNFPDWQQFSVALNKKRRLVETHFEQVFAAPQAEAAPDYDDQTLSDVWHRRVNDERAEAILCAHGYEDGTEALRRIGQLSSSHACRMSGPVGQARLDQLMPLMLGSVAKVVNPDETLVRVLNLIEVVARRTAYLALLVENPMALSQLVQLFAASSWIAELLSQHPILMDELLDPRTLYAPPSREEMAQQLSAEIALVDEGDLERQMDVMRDFKQANVLRVAAADLMDVLPLMVVSDHLSWLAEVLLKEALTLAANHLRTKNRKKGKKSSHNGVPTGFIVVAYGKMGGVELGYGSDLDLVFIHATPKGDDNGIFYSRLGQRLIHMLNTLTPAGMLYEVDMRLRPNGASGLLVSDIAAFEGYQREDAWIWEHQALTRARVVAGDANLAAQFEAVRHEVLTRQRNETTLRQEVREMREKMRRELVRGGEDQFDVKQGAGGIADIEFMVQFGVLRWAHQHSELLEFTDNIRILERFERCGLAQAADVALLSEAYRAYRCCIHRFALQEQKALVGGGEFHAFRDGVVALWNRWMKK
ncbi:MAG: bifunctional [glutamate--ammonia ligase]-adenylyl-L-tyrosine phosphorylase/[glutamate--ammonia-ligase] adenylyltransferase [Gammaproteobacteria bacterium]|nr:bifunctional [glutamate--ammonia ligase]-adenylyl-L-tyrosine phosphorylase/[glutamate--ammonia-ligase] adenylyltransferase [Gammaproteobacteria bacterium]